MTYGDTAYLKTQNYIKSLYNQTDPFPPGWITYILRYLFKIKVVAMYVYVV